MAPRWTALVVTAGLALAGQPAFGNGAFPASDALLLPPDRPNQFLLATNFGIIESADGGASWQWTCERPETAMGVLYGMGPPPAHRLFCLSDVGLAVSNDGACTWHKAAGALDDLLATDYFPDPDEPARVLAIATAAVDGGGGASSLFVSADGGDSFDPSPMFTAPPGAALLGVEIARSDPRVAWLAMLLPGSQPALVHTRDGGGTWTTIDVTPGLGPNPVRLIAVDATDPDRLVLRVGASGGDVLALSDDGGTSFRTPVTVPDRGALTAFVRLGSGTLLVAGFVPLGGPDAGGATRGVAWRSTDGGNSFSEWNLDPQPHLLALAERDGKLYLAGKNYSDGWAIAVSSDEGRTVTPVMRYDQVSSIKVCAMPACQDSCDSQAGVKIWSPEVCTGALRDGGRDGGPPGDGGGCGCATAPGRMAGLLALAPIAMLLLTRRRARDHRSRADRG